jgi:glucokinase
VATLIRDRAIRYLGAAISGLLHVFDPEVVILGGQIVEAGPALLEPLQREMNRRAKGLLRRDVPLVLQQVQDRSGIVGAAALVFAEQDARQSVS